LFNLIGSIYDRLIPMPPPLGRDTSPRMRDDETYLFEVSVIVPCHDGEPLELVQRTIRKLYQHCHNPGRVELVLVHAVGPPRTDTNIGLKPQQESASSSPRLDLPSLLREERLNRSDPVRRWWGHAKCVTYRGGGGRGPALNLGAVCSQGRIVVFVHSDCQLPADWDAKIASRILNDPQVSATTFLLGVDCSGTSWIKSLFGFGFASIGDSAASTSFQYPWGIVAVQIMVNLRTYFLRMPYGDQGIAMRSSYFAYIGGFPNQPIMEDFDLMSYLRERSNYLENRERYSLIWSTSWSSPRRWQRVGVLYVTIGNAVLVHRYTRKHNRWTPGRVYEYYYNKRPSSSNQKSASNEENAASRTNARNNAKLD
jgi:hypothetical protein